MPARLLTLRCCLTLVCVCSLNRAYTTKEESPEPTFTDVLTVPCTGTGKALEYSFRSPRAPVRHRS
jgi:hypothetical protein